MVRQHYGRSYKESSGPSTGDRQHGEGCRKAIMDHVAESLFFFLLRTGLVSQCKTEARLLFPRQEVGKCVENGGCGHQYHAPIVTCPDEKPRNLEVC